jgi:putative glutamine amidotransferase
MRPIVGVSSCRRMRGLHPFHMVGEKYIAAVRDGSGATPLLIPSFENPLSPDDILDSVKGLLFTGSPSNVAPEHYRGQAPDEEMLLDPYRDAITLPLIRAAIERGVPVLAICRGFQELNVALGGTLYQKVHDVPGRMDHREDESADLDTQYGPSHDVHLTEGSLLARLTGTKTCRVNSLHHQGIDRLAPGLAVDAVAPDGQIEAVTLSSAKAFVLGVQWHPEWRWSENPVSRAIFAAFGAALNS